MPENGLEAKLPLQEAFCEVTFPGDPEVELARSSFYRKNKKEFPDLYVPNSSEGQAIALQHYRFVSADQRAVGIAVHSFYYSVTGETYKDFETFKEGFKQNLKRFTEVYPYLEGFTRVALRYINHLPIRRGVEGEITYMPLELPTAIKAQLRNTLRVGEFQLGNGIIRAVVDTTNKELESRNLALLDFDFSFRTDVTNLINLDQVEARLDEAHETVKESLKTFIDAEYAKEVGITWP